MNEAQIEKYQAGNKGFGNREKERAMLIAAAPEMYWVLAEVEIELRHQYPALARRVSAALAKARGES